MPYWVMFRVPMVISEAEPGQAALLPPGSKRCEQDWRGWRELFLVFKRLRADISGNRNTITEVNWLEKPKGYSYTMHQSGLYGYQTRRGLHSWILAWHRRTIWYIPSVEIRLWSRFPFSSFQMCLNYRTASGSFVISSAVEGILRRVGLTIHSRIVSFAEGLFVKVVDNSATVFSQWCLNMPRKLLIKLELTLYIPKPCFSLCRRRSISN